MSVEVVGQVLDDPEAVGVGPVEILLGHHRHPVRRVPTEQPEDGFTPHHG
jgi:hypothetical protein